MRVMLKSAILLLLFTHIGLVQALEPTDEAIRRYSEAILDGNDGIIAGQKIAATTLLPIFYTRRGFQPAWSEPQHFQQLLQALKSAEEHGLDPEDYHYSTLSTWSDDGSPRQRAARDMLATDALIRYGYQLHLGKIDPASLDPDWNLTRQLKNEEPITVLERTVATPDLSNFLATELAPTGPFYTGLRQALAHYRKLASEGGWPKVLSGPTLHAGERDARIPALRARLSVTDAELTPNTAEATLFDNDLAAAVIRFQLQHGLDDDGAIGARTLEALNVPVETRIDQLRVNLERTRWVFRDLAPRFLVVNIASFHAYLLDDNNIVWDSRVQVGKPFRQTPIFKANMTYLVLNPTWTVPPTILRNDTIPRIRKNPDYLAQNNMVLLNRSGQVIDTNKVDLRSVTPANFPYTVRQEPGPKNALGRIKFMFPNKHAVYLHDTPSQSLFNRAERAFSSGCIRVEKPFSLAATLLNDPNNWSKAKIETKLASAKNETVNLKNPITVFLMYWTSMPDGKGDARFYADVYTRDQAVLDGLKQPFRLIAMR